MAPAALPMQSASLAIFGDLGFQELLLVALASVIIFGRRLPQVAARGYAEFQRVRRTLTQMWRETGIEDEIRRVQRELERAIPRDLDPAALARQRTRELERALGTQPRAAPERGAATALEPEPEPAEAPPAAPDARVVSDGAEGAAAAPRPAPPPAERADPGAQSH